LLQVAPYRSRFNPFCQPLKPSYLPQATPPSPLNHCWPHLTLIHNTWLHHTLIHLRLHNTHTHHRLHHTLIHNRLHNTLIHHRLHNTLTHLRLHHTLTLTTLCHPPPPTYLASRCPVHSTLQCQYQGLGPVSMSTQTLLEHCLQGCGRRLLMSTHSTVNTHRWAGFLCACFVKNIL